MSLLLLLNGDTPSTPTPNGTFVVSFADYTPGPRYDGTPWTAAMVEEAPTKDGPWTERGSVTLTPVDTDPTNPQSRDMTLVGATLEIGWYRITFLDDDGNEQPTTPILNGPSYLATREDVARKLEARTRTDQGGLVGTFDATTTITGELVDDMIADAGALVAARLGEIPADKTPLARRAVAIRAAMEVELSFTPEQTGGDETAYGRLLEQYEEAMTALEGSLNDDTPNTARFGSLTVTSPTMTAQNALITPAELLP